MQLASHLNILKYALVDTTKPAMSKREKSDLHVWREIFTLYEHSAIICPTKECTCIIEELDTIQSRYASFWSVIASHQLVIPGFLGANRHLDDSISAVSKSSNFYGIQGSSDVHERNSDDGSQRSSNSALYYRISYESFSKEYWKFTFHIKFVAPLTPPCKRG